MIRCRTCGEMYSEFGDGWDGECPSCADRTCRREMTKLITSQDVTVFDPEHPHDMPIYDHIAANAHDVLEPGLYPGTGEEGEAVLLVVLPSESFAVTTDETYRAIVPLPEGTFR